MHSGDLAGFHTIRAVEYDTNEDAWRTVESRFHTARALYLANQDIWLGQWAGDFYEGRGVPWKTDDPPARAGDRSAP